MPLKELSPEWKDRRSEAMLDAQSNTIMPEKIERIKELGYTVDQYVNQAVDSYRGEIRDKIFAIIATEELNEEINLQ